MPKPVVARMWQGRTRESIAEIYAEYLYEEGVKVQAFTLSHHYGGRLARPLARQISPNKNMNYQCTTAAFTLSPVPVGFVIWCGLALAVG
jgi:hypothetical protein